MNASADLWAVTEAMRSVKLPKGVRWMTFAREDDAMVGVLVRDGPEPVHQQVHVRSPYEAAQMVATGLNALG